MSAARTVWIVIEILTGSVWIGSLLCLALVSAVARRELDGPSRVAFFRGIGRVYGQIGTGSLVLAIIAALVLAWPPSGWSTSGVVALVLSIALLALTGLGMAQARRMTVVRRQALALPQDQQLAQQVKSGAAMAGVLRGGIALVTLVIVVIAAGLINR